MRKYLSTLMALVLLLSCIAAGEISEIPPAPAPSALPDVESMDLEVLPEASALPESSPEPPTASEAAEIPPVAETTPFAPPETLLPAADAGSAAPLPGDVPTASAIPEDEESADESSSQTEEGVADEIPAKETSAEITLNAAAVKLGVKENFQIIAALEGDEAAVFSYASTDKNIASVDKYGKISGKKAGETRIIVSCGSLTAECAVTVVKAPSKVTLSAAKLSLGVGQTAALTAGLNNGNESAVIFSSSKPAVASVDENGLITAHTKGTAKITAKAYNGKKASCTVTVLAAPEEIYLKESAVSLPVGMDFALAASVNKGAAAQFSFASSDENVATVDRSGLITAIENGEAEISISTYNGLCAVCSVTVTAAPTALFLNTDSAELGVKENMQLIASNDVQCEAAYDYSSSNAKIASVNSSGLVTAKKAGSARITVTSYNGLTASCEITVGKAPSKLSLSAKALTLGAGQSERLLVQFNSGAAGSVRFSSNDESVAAVDESGVVTAVSTGKAVVTAKSYNGRKASCSITVLPAPSSLILAESSAVLPQGMTLDLKPAVNEGAVSSFTFTSSDEAVAIADEHGVVTALGIGTAVITAQSYNGITAECAVTVVPAPTMIELATSKLELGQKESRQLNARTDQGNHAKLRYESEYPKIASIDESGMITANRSGETAITVTAYNGVSARCTVTVRKAPSHVSLSASSLELETGDRCLLTAQVNEGAAGKISFTSDSECVLIDESGMITAVSEGVASVIAETYNGKKAVCTVHVVWSPDRFYEFEFAEESCIITKYIGSESHVRIPSEIDGFPVTAIAESAFAGCSTLESVEIPECVAVIGARAFANCPRLRSIS